MNKYNFQPIPPQYTVIGGLLEEVSGGHPATFSLPPPSDSLHTFLTGDLTLREILISSLPERMYLPSRQPLGR